MPANKNWSRWLQASLATHFDDRREDVPFFVEGQIRPSTVVDFAELRTDGPFFNEINFEYWHVDLTVAILIQIVQDGNLHKLDNMIGVFMPAFTKAICCYRMGDGIDDDNLRFGVLRLRNGLSTC